MNRRWLLIGLVGLVGCGRKGALKLPPPVADSTVADPPEDAQDLEN